MIEELLIETIKKIQKIVSINYLQSLEETCQGRKIFIALHVFLLAYSPTVIHVSI